MNIKRPVIDPAYTAFDFDGVVADTMNLFLDIARHDFGINHLKYDDFTEYMIEECLDIPSGILDEIFDMINNGTYSHTLMPMQDTEDVLCRFGSITSPLLVVTARPDSRVVEDWFGKHLGSCLEKWDIKTLILVQIKVVVMRCWGCLQKMILIRFVVKEQTESL